MKIRLFYHLFFYTNYNGQKTYIEPMSYIELAFLILAISLESVYLKFIISYSIQKILFFR